MKCAKMCLTTVLFFLTLCGGSSGEEVPVPNPASGPSAVGPAAATDSLAGVDVAAITAANPKIHSWLAMDVENGSRIGHQIEVQPREVASTIKLALMNAVLKKVSQGAIPLDEELTVTGTRDLAAGDEIPVGSKRSVKQAIYAVFEHSDNTCSNLLINRLGGLAAVNALLPEMGYARTRYGYHLPVAGAEGIDTKKTSTVLDMATAARDFFRTFRQVQGLASGTAWDGFAHTIYPIRAEGHITLGNKIGSNDFCSTNTGLYEVAGRVYAIAAFTEENGEADNHAANAITRKVTTDIADAIARAAAQAR